MIDQRLKARRNVFYVNFSRIVVVVITNKLTPGNLWVHAIQRLNVGHLFEVPGVAPVRIAPQITLKIPISALVREAVTG